MSDKRLTYPPTSGERAMLLILACAALGFTASMVNYERSALQSERTRAQMLATQCSFAEGKLEDLGKFLGEPGTKLMQLAGNGANGVSEVAVAVNGSEGRGYFLCDNLPALKAGSGYEIWAVKAGADAVKWATIQPQPGMSVYPFEMGSRSVGKARLEISAGPRAQNGTPIFSGEIE